MSRVVTIYSIDSDIDVIEEFPPAETIVIDLFYFISRLFSYYSIVFNFIDLVVFKYSRNFYNEGRRG